LHKYSRWPTTLLNFSAKKATKFNDVESRDFAFFLILVLSIYGIFAKEYEIVLKIIPILSTIALIKPLLFLSFARVWKTATEVLQQLTTSLLLSLVF